MIASLFYIYIKFWQFNFFTQTCRSTRPHIEIYWILNIILHLFRGHLRQVLLSHSSNFLSFLWTKWMENCEAMNSSTHAFAYSYWLFQKCFVKICKNLQSHIFLTFNRIFINFSLFFFNFVYSFYWINLNLNWIFPLIPNYRCRWRNSGGWKNQASRTCPTCLSILPDMTCASVWRRQKRCYLMSRASRHGSQKIRQPCMQCLINLKTLR